MRQLHCERCGAGLRPLPSLSLQTPLYDCPGPESELPAGVDEGDRLLTETAAIYHASGAPADLPYAMQPATSERLGTRPVRCARGSV